MSEIPAVVSNRNHFESLEDSVDYAMAWAMSHKRTESAGFAVTDHEKFRAWLVAYSSTVLNRLVWALKTGAERGIEQAAALVEDPNYYAARKNRRKKSIIRHAEERERERNERLMSQTKGVVQ